MNYKLIMTEGKTEKAFLEVLLEKKILKFKRKDLLGDKIYWARQISSDNDIVNMLQLLRGSDNVTIYRVGDQMNDVLKIPNNILPNKIKEIIKVSTLPEFEILFILHEGLHKQFLNEKSKKKPSEFYKEHNKKYSKQSDFVRDYFNKMTNQEIKDLVKLYIGKCGQNHNSTQENLSVIIE